MVLHVSLLKNLNMPNVVGITALAFYLRKLIGEKRLSTPTFVAKHSIWDPCEQARTVLQNISFLRRSLIAKCVCVSA